MRIGFVGTGHIAAALVTGLAASANPDERVLLSPRSAETAARLASTLPNVTVAADNQAVVDGSDVVFLAVLPRQAHAVLRALRFESRHLLISLVALTPLAVVHELAPAPTIVRAVPLPSAALCASPVPFYPDEPRARALFDRVGTALPLADERALSVLWTGTALLAPTFALVAEIAGWLEREGIPADTAARFTVSQFAGLMALAGAAPPGQYDTLARQAATPGGLNEQALAQLRAAGVYDAFRGALDAVLQRLMAAQADANRPA
jgi:pyrroline-5-carboxylate reductase